MPSKSNGVSAQDRYANPFGKNVSYLRITLASLMERAQNPAYSRATRVEFAALARCNKAGHAQFGRGELAQILGDERSGSYRPAASSEVTRAIKEGKVRGAILPESCARCVVVSPDMASQGRGGNGCMVHAQ